MLNFDLQSDAVYKRFSADPVGYASEYEKNSTEAHSFRIRRQRVFEMLKGCEKGVVLDIGCGPGVTVDFLLEDGWKIHGIDISENMIETCRERFAGNPDAKFSVGKIENIDLPDASVNAVLCMGVVEYLEDDQLALAEMTRVLKPGGVLIVTCPNVWAPWRIWSRIFWGATNPFRKLLGKSLYNEVWHREYHFGAYTSLMEEAGLECVDACYYNFKMFIEPTNKWFPAANVQVSEALEAQARSPLRWLGTGFIVKAIKKP